MGVALDELEGKISLEESSPDGFDCDICDENQDDPVELEGRNDIE